MATTTMYPGAVLVDYTGTITVTPYGGAGIKVSNVRLNFLALIH